MSLWNTCDVQLLSRILVSPSYDVESAYLLVLGLPKNSARIGTILKIGLNQKKVECQLAGRSEFFFEMRTPAQPVR